MKFKETKYGDLTGKEHDGDIDLSGVNLTSLEGAPEVMVNGDFNVSHNPSLTSLKGGPTKFITNEKKDGDEDYVYNASFCDIKDLDGLPTKLNFTLNLSNNTKLKSLKGLPNETLSIFFNSCELESLDGMPDEVNGYLSIWGNPDVVINKVPKSIGSKVYLWDNEDNTGVFPEQVFDFHKLWGKSLEIYETYDEDEDWKDIQLVMLEFLDKIIKNIDITWEHFKKIYELNDGIALNLS